MITVYRAETGQFVLVHQPSQTVVIGEDLQATFDRVREVAGDGAVAPPPAHTTESSRRSWHLLGLLAVAVLPFVWLLALHWSLGSLVSELRRATVDPPPAAEDGVDALGELRLDLDRLGTEVATLRRQNAPDRPPSARTPSGPAREEEPVGREADSEAAAEATDEPP